MDTKALSLRKTDFFRSSAKTSPNLSPAGDVRQNIRRYRVMAEIVLINPRFDPSFWGMEHAMPLFGKKANLPVACLPLLAALTPRHHKIALLDENVEPIDFDIVCKADLVGLTGMIVQRVRMREILLALKKRGVFTAVGGPWISVQEHYFGDLADVIFVGEAEETWPRFLEQWQHGRHARRYEQSERTDMTRVPAPRFELLRMRHYMFGSIQFSRGCPYQCEFCDIIVTFGRRPRLKTSRQIIAELEALRAQKIFIAFVVDDNLIGNKKAIKSILRDLTVWQRNQGYPMRFFTEASLDLAEDPELLQLMVEANFGAVFIGIESPNEASLRETKKIQNLRRGKTLVERIHTIQRAGLEVWSGMILGFDSDDASIFDFQRQFLGQARITHAMLGMLTAIPKTPLYDRLARDGRLDRDDISEYGTNVIPLKMSRDVLLNGYVKLLNELYEPGAFFGRVDDLFLEQRTPFFSGMREYYRHHPWRRFGESVKNLSLALGLFGRLMCNVSEISLRREYRRRIVRVLQRRPDPHVLFLYTIKCAMHYHHYIMAREMAAGRSVPVNSF
jgi:radical SAM superfamily enzyme YgiQ (UPF0313 family)